jgi:hypothetical protein
MIAAVRRLSAPDGNERIAIDARQAFDTFERRFVLSQEGSALHCELVEIGLR